MKTTPVAIDLNRVAAAIEAGVATAEDRRMAAEALRALVLPASRFAERDSRIIECRQRFFVDHSDRDAAHEIATGLRRYSTSGWLRERSSPDCPARIAGTVKGAYWEILKAAPAPLTPERIRKIVGHFAMTHADSHGDSIESTAREAS